MAELSHRRLPFEKIDPASHFFDPRDREHRYSVIVNRISPSSHRRGHGNVLFYAEPLLAHYEAVGVPVINPVASWRVEKSKALRVEYLVGRDDGCRYVYDVNATSNFVANAPAVLGFDPFPRFADFIVRVATRGR